MAQTFAISLLLSCALPLAGVVAQVPGVQATLTADRSIALIGGTIDLKLVLDIKADTEVSGNLLTGTMLEVKLDDKPGPKVEVAGKGGNVALTANTRIERRLSVPVASVLGAAAPGAAGFTYCELSWPGLPGASCVVKVAPDISKIDIDQLDLAKTKVVLVTNYGEMTLSFRPDKAPGHVKNFIELAKKGFYDGTKFHRVIRNFMIQGGDPLTKDDSKEAQWGTGDPGYKINAEFNDLKHTRGVLSMARSNDPNSAGSQFFIVHKDAEHLDGKYTAFGNLEKGADVLDSIASVAVGGPQGSAPQKPVILQAAIVLPALK